MKKILTITLVLIANIVFAQNAQKTNAILKAVEQMKSDADYTVKVLNSEEFIDPRSGETGELFGYFKNGHLEKIHLRMALAKCIRTDKFYLQNDTLILFYRQERAFPYNETTKVYDSAHPITSMECRYYYDNRELLKTDSKGEPKCSEKPSEQQAMEMIDACRKYAKLLKK